MRRAHWLTASALALSVALASCGGGSGSKLAQTGGQPNTVEGLKAAAKAADEAVFSGDTRAAYNVFSQQCRSEVSYKEFAATLAGASALVEAFAEIKLSDIEVTSVDVSNFGGGKGDVEVHTRDKKDPNLSLDSDSPDATTWSYEDGHWVMTDCSDMTVGTDAASPSP